MKTATEKTTASVDLTEFIERIRFSDGNAERKSKNALTALTRLSTQLPETGERLWNRLREIDGIESKLGRADNYRLLAQEIAQTLDCFLREALLAVDDAFCASSILETSKLFAESITRGIAKA